MNPKQPRIQPDGPLEGYEKRGRSYLSPLAATGVLQLGDWVRDDLPDLIWPVLLMGLRGEQSMLTFTRLQQAVVADLKDSVSAQLLADGLDGRLTGLDRLVAAAPDSEAVLLKRIIEFDLMPEAIQGVLASYPERPAPWLTPPLVSEPEQAHIDLLVNSIAGVMSNGHHEALLKCLSIWSTVATGTFRSNAQTIDLLKHYPNDPAMRTAADSVVRALWGARKAPETDEEGRFDSAIKWSKVFWGINSMTTNCVRDRDLSNSGTSSPLEDAPTAKRPAEGAHLRRLAMDLMSSYIEAVDTAPQMLYDPSMQEVHTGLVNRAGRDVIAALGSPDLWNIEHGAHIGRMLVEVRILLQWMSTQEPEIYAKYQAYGSGKAKLHARIAKEIPADVLDERVSAAIDAFTRLGHDHDVLDARIVDTSDSFSGKSLRAMAEESGLLDFYRHAYAIASGVVHSESWSIETNAMERCLNVLHRGHLIPSLSLAATGDAQLAASWVDSLLALIRFSLSALRTEEMAVTNAFAWLDEDADDDADDSTR